MTMLSEEVQEAIDLVAAEFKYIQDLHLKIALVTKFYTAQLAIINRTGDEKKCRQLRRELVRKVNMKKALMLARYIGKAERRANRPIHEVLKAFEKVDDSNVQRLAKQVDIPNKILVKETSIYFGTLRKHLKKLNRLIDLEAIYPKKSIEAKIQQKLSELDTEVGELETSVQSLEAGLRKINESQLPAFMNREMTRRKFMPVAAAGTAGIAALLSNPFAAIAEPDKEKLEEDKVIAGKLYILPYFGGREELHQVLFKVQSNFAEVGILFESIEIITEDNLPKLNKLDILFLVVIRPFKREEWTHENIASFGNTGYTIKKIAKIAGVNMDKVLNFYGEDIVLTNIGMMGFEQRVNLSHDVIKEFAKGYSRRDIMKKLPENSSNIEAKGFPDEVSIREIKEDFYRKIRIAINASTLTHEIGHAFGLGHVVKPLSGVVSASSLDFMSYRLLGEGFDAGNVRAMKRFIMEVKKRSFSSAEEFALFRRGAQLHNKMRLRDSSFNIFAR